MAAACLALYSESSSSPKESKNKTMLVYPHLLQTGKSAAIAKM